MENFQVFNFTINFTIVFFVHVKHPSMESKTNNIDFNSSNQHKQSTSFTINEVQELISMLNGEESSLPIVDNNNNNNDSFNNNNNNENSDIPVFECNENDYITIQCELNSSFDQLLRRQWHKAMNAGLMDYSTEPGCLPTKVISPNKYKFVVKLLEGRGPGKRRTPDTMLALDMPFNPDKFNFTKVKPAEILFRIKLYNSELKKHLEATVLVNKSPIEYCSSLLVPYLERCLPQVMTEEALILAVSIISLSDFPSLRLAYNSLGSMASVNHLHWHLYYCDSRLAVETLPINDYVLQEWPIPAIVFEITDLNDESITIIIKDAMRIIDFCIDDGQICHNLFITRTPNGIIRIFIWLLEPRWGQKDNANVNVACCELSGYFMCKSAESFETINEKKCIETLQSVKTLHEKVLPLLQ